jgi:hypothetical protein
MKKGIAAYFSPETIKSLKDRQPLQHLGVF